MARDIVAYCNGLSKAVFWSLGTGGVQNLLDEALEEIERLREQLRLVTIDQALAEADANDARLFLAIERTHSDGGDADA